MRQRLNRRTSDRKLGRALDECEARRSVVRALSEQRRAIQRAWGHLDLEARYARLSAVVEKLKVPKYGDASTTLGISMGLLNMQYALTVDEQV